MALSVHKRKTMEEQKELISKDDLESLTAMIGQFERAQYALQTYQNHISQKYLKEGDGIKPDGEIVRAVKPSGPVAVPDEKAATG